MLNMSERFYDYIADTIFGYFNQNNTVLPGSRYSLKLDTMDMVDGVDRSLKKYAKERNIYEEYDLGNLNYKTYTINLGDDMKLVVAAQSGQMTDDFFTTLRNTRFTDQLFPLLMITSTQNDSLISGTGDLSATGMPFNVENIVKSISAMIDDVQDKYIQEIYKHELAKKSQDRFTDRSSLFEYQDLIVSLKKGSFDHDDFYKFSLLPYDKLITTTRKEEIRKLIEEDEKEFNYLDDIFKHNDIQESLENKYKKDFIGKLKEKKKNNEPWYEGLSLEQVKNSKVTRSHQPLQIDEESIVISGEGFDSKEFIKDTDYFIRNDGETKAKSRRKNILIFNPDYYLKIYFSFKTNRAISQSNMTVKGDQIKNISSNNKEYKFEMISEKINFNSIDVGLEGVKYKFSICIVNIDPDYFKSLLTNYTISSSRINLVNLKGKLVFNPGKDHRDEVNLYDSMAEGNVSYYKCEYNKTLQINIDEEKCFVEMSKRKVNISVGEIEIPFEIKNGIVKSAKLSGVKVMIQKMKMRSSFEYRNNKLYHTTLVYDINDNLRTLLEYEKFIIDHKALYVESSFSNNTAVEINIADEIKDAYDSLIDEIVKLHTLPSLVYYEKDSAVRNAAENYIKVVSYYFKNIQVGIALNKKDNDLLKVGVLKDGNSFYLTPLHPLNVLYQLQLTEETGWEQVREDIVKKMNGLFLMPFIKDENGDIFKAIDQEVSLEWKEYALETDEKYHSSRSYISKLVNNKIMQYRKHFDFLFSTLGNLEFKINLVNMGDCREVLNGLLDYFVSEVNHVSDLTELMNFTIHVYSNLDYNELNILSDQSRLKAKLESLYSNQNVDINELLLIAADHIHCYYHEMEEVKNLEYSHLTFYEMDSDQKSTHCKIEETTTGLSLGGLLSDVPSVLYQDNYYITGFGTRFASKDNQLIEFASYYNTLMAVAYDPAPYDQTEALYTRVDRNQEVLLDSIYSMSNWVVFVDPKVDLTFFKRTHKEGSELMIIHYSDQYSSTSGYDDITVTEKSSEYCNIIKEYFEMNAIHIEQQGIYDIINLFNAVNGDWLLNLLTMKNTTSNKASNYSREKMSLLSAIKYCKAKFRHKNITWVPISLEEMLRVSGALGLSKKDGLLSAKNLQFDKGSTSDDILMVGVENVNGEVKVYLHPVEVKIGQNDESRIKKAKEQVENTYNGLWKAFWSDDTRHDLEHKVSRNFFIQLVIVSAEKMKLYEADPDENWDRVLKENREALLNDQFIFSKEMDQYVGKGTIVSFDSNTTVKSVEELESNIWKVEFSERDGFGFMTRTVNEIFSMLQQDPNEEYSLLSDSYVANGTISGSQPLQDTNSSEELRNNDNNTKIVAPKPILNDVKANSSDKDHVNSEIKTDFEYTHTTDTNRVYTIADNKEEYSVTNEDTPSKEEVNTEKVDADKRDERVPSNEPRSMQINFGTNISNGKSLYWYPNDTDQLTHTNTGIIGTMGTGKTQFTKSLITQLYKNRKDNYLGEELGILIFDYKGDYNKPDEEDGFVGLTNAKNSIPYDFPFNPLALTKPKVFRPLLPMHVANTFKDTISKVFHLGNKQESILFDCIKQAYISKGIIPSDPLTWDREPPTFETVFKIYNENEEIKKNDSLAAAMNKLHNFQVFEPDPKKTKSLYDILHGVYVIELSGFNDDIQNLVVAITLDLFYNQMQSQGSSKTNGRYRELTKFILVDEADNFMSQDFASLKKILKEGREFGVGVILSTQFLSHFGTDEDDYSKYILTWVVHKVSDLKGQDVDYIFGVGNKSPEEKKLMNDISFLEKHHSIVKIDNMDPIYIEDKPFWKLKEELNQSSD